MLVEIDVQCDQWYLAIENLEQLINNVAKEVINELKISDISKNIELSVVLSDNNFVKELNNQYRGINKPTNVLSFPGEEFDCSDLSNLISKVDILLLGDVIFAYEVVASECKEQDKKIEEHFSHLLVHGILHLFGYDHIDDKDAEEMESLEAIILKKFNINI